MKTTYRTRYSWWIVATMIALTLVTPCIMIFNGFNWFALIFAVLYVIFVLDLLLRTSYQIEDDKLNIRAGLFKATIDIGKIPLIEHVKNITNANSFAWSTDRLVVHAPRGYKYMLSPKDEDAFIAELLRINPRIKVL